MGDPYQSADLTSPGELYEMGLKTSPAYRDLDGSLTKAYMMSQRDDEEEGRFLALTMNKRPKEELYLIYEDPYQLNNLADDPKHAAHLKLLRSRIDRVMKHSNDPRLTDTFDRAPWVAGQAQKSSR